MIGMKILAVAAFVFASAFLVAGAAAVGAEVKVVRQLVCEPRHFSVEEHNGLLTAKAELYNSGTVGYAARARLDIYEGSGGRFTAWSGEKVLMPGERSTYLLYWFSGEGANLTASMGFDCATEHEEAGNYSVAMGSVAAENPFSILNAVTYADRVRVETISSKDLGEVHAYVSDYVPGWLFEEASASSIKAGKRFFLDIPYSTGVFVNASVTINLADESGSYYAASPYAMRRVEGVVAVWDMLIDWIRSVTGL
jgi:hypothetical protein